MSTTLGKFTRKTEADYQIRVQSGYFRNYSRLFRWYAYKLYRIDPNGEYSRETREILSDYTGLGRLADLRLNMSFTIEATPLDNPTQVSVYSDIVMPEWYTIRGAKFAIIGKISHHQIEDLRLAALRAPKPAPHDMAFPAKAELAQQEWLKCLARQMPGCIDQRKLTNFFNICDATTLEKKAIYRARAAEKAKSMSASWASSSRRLSRS